MKRVVFLAACAFVAFAVPTAILFSTGGVHAGPEGGRAERPVATATVVDLSRELMAIDPSGRYQAYLRRRARDTGATFDSLLAKWADHALTPVDAETAAGREKFSGQLLTLFRVKADDPRFDALVEEATKTGGATRDKVLGIVDAIGNIAAAAEMTREDVLLVVEGKKRPNAEPVRSQLQISAAQRTELRRRGIVGDEAIAEYLQNQARAVPARRAAYWQSRTNSLQRFQQQQDTAARQQAIVFAAVQNANAQRLAAQRQQAAAAAAYYAQPLAPAYGSPFYENVQHAGNQTYIYGYGPYGNFNETIQHVGNQTFISGYGPYGNFNETIQGAGNQAWISGSGPYGPFNETIQHIGNQTFVNGYGVPPSPWAGGYGWGGYGGGY